MISPDLVTACLVTRGDQPRMMERIRESLIFPHGRIWDNSREEDRKCFGRYEAMRRASTEVVYFQDDDVIVPAETQRRLCEAYMPGVMVANWGHGENPAGYDDLPLVCGGAIVDVEVCERVIERYLEHFPADEDFLYYCDFAVGVLYEDFRHLYLPFEIDYAIAQAPERLCNQPWAAEMKARITNQARSVRDMVAA